MQLYDEQNNRWVRHRDLPEYRLRKRKVRDAWIFLGCILIFLPFTLTIVFALLGAFISLMFLDEKPYNISRAQTRN